MTNSKSTAHGGLNGGGGGTQSASLSSSAAKENSTLATSEKTATPTKSQIGFQPTKPLEESKETINARLVVTFANELGALVEWRKIELGDGREVYALCFPTNAWTINDKGELVPKEKALVP